MNICRLAVQEYSLLALDGLDLSSSVSGRYVFSPRTPGRSIFSPATSGHSNVSPESHELLKYFS